MYEQEQHLFRFFPRPDTSPVVLNMHLMSSFLSRPIYVHLSDFIQYGK